MNKIGDIKCKDLHCRDCILHFVLCKGYNITLTLNEIKECILKDNPILEPMRSTLEFELNKTIK